MANFPGFNISSMFRNTPRVQISSPGNPGGDGGQGQSSQYQQQQQTPGAGTGGAPGGQQQQNGPGSSMQQRNDPMNQNGGGATGNNNQGSPLDNWTEMFKNDGSGGNPAADPFAEPLFGIDATKIRDAASKMDFMSAVPQEIMQKALSGDFQAMMQAMNHVAQHTLGTSLQLGTSQHDLAATKMGERFKKALPDSMRQYLLQQQRSSNPALEHPAAAPIVKSLRSTIAQANPDLSPQQVQQQVEEYMESMATAYAGGNPDFSARISNGAQAAAAEKGEASMDWMDWISPSQQTRT